MKNIVIKVKHLSKLFKSEKKEQNSILKNIFCKEYSVIKAVDDISFEVNSGEFVALIGSNGAGKTTTLKCLTGLLKADKGDIEILGFKPLQREQQFLQNITLVMGHKSQLWWELPPIETFLLNKEIYQIEDKDYDQRLKEMCNVLGIEDIINTPTRKLSLGERMKCELVASLLHAPKLLFLDEPTLGLDLVAQKRLRDFLKEYHRKNNATIILTSHNMEDLRDLCKRIIILDKGKIVYDGGLKDLTKTYVDNKFLNFVLGTKVDVEKIKKYGEVVEFDGISGIISLQRNRVAEKTAKLLEELDVEDVNIQEPTLEIVVEKIFREG